ncbi:MAG: precorrin-6Y C5,15-methyltransferase (decarboxylating) subunit CbiT [Spirochaetes bacterium]|nr:precorrin-6Y C5,15-methyltransferase (decarboxylating) subunit CbiT [Spirochaetota bacterium]
MINSIIPGIPDDEFIRGNVPMTKEEIRVLSLSKLRLEADSILLDVGAGTGSVSIEAALILKSGKVYSIERKAEAIELIEKNCKKFKVENIKIIAGEAPADLPEAQFNRAFIGGSGGNFFSILEWIDLNINADGIIAVNAVTLETLKAADDFFISKEYSTEIIQVAITRAEKKGNSTMMKAQNPIFLITACKNGVC